MAEHKPTFASVTTKPCECRWPRDVTAEPENSVVFDSETNEYQFRTPKGGSLTIYHCPFCGGVMPRSKRAELFAYITEAERDRLATLTSGMESVADAIRVLGKPQHDHAGAWLSARRQGAVVRPALRATESLGSRACPTRRMLNSSTTGPRVFGLPSKGSISESAEAAEQADAADEAQGGTRMAS